MRTLRRGLGVGVAVALALATVGAASRGNAAGPPASPRTAPLLDKAKAGRAVAAYQKAMNALCDTLWLSADDKPMRPQWDPNNYDVERSAAPHKGGELVAAKLKAIGLERADDIPLCEKRDPAARALASGSFITPGADEVLLEVWNGASGSATSTVAVMRGDGKSYRLVKHLPIGGLSVGNRFEARLRLTTQSRRDVLFLCESGGMQGVYPATCGFFGSGTFREPVERLPTIANPAPEAPADPGRDDEIDLVLVTTCGPVASVEWGGAAARGDRLLVDVVVAESVRKPVADEDPSACGKETDRKTSKFTIEYKFDGTRYRRGPVPAAVKEVLGRI